jgi:NAD(P)-dependent dehydrogenase (short-subunit alcohol dehydrogenase family)
MTDMTGKIVMVTGATDGIGKVTARELAKMGATVVAVGRNRAKGESVVNEIKALGGHNIEFMAADLSSMAEVRKLADDFKRKYDRLHVLVNNAGAIFTSRKQSIDGYEMTLALNHLNYFLLTHLLLDVLKTSIPSRIVNVSSDAHTSGRLDFSDLQSQRFFNPMRVYGTSKLMNIMFTYELARRLEGTGVTANVLHPGLVRTQFGKNNGLLVRGIMIILQRLGGITVEQGAETMIYLASSPEVEGVTGKYFYKCKPMKTIPASYDEAAAKRLWEVSEQLTGTSTPATV